jgi:hypothetical protein
MTVLGLEHVDVAEQDHTSTAVFCLVLWLAR